MASSESVKNPYKQQTPTEPKFAQVDKVLYKWFTVMHSKGKPITLPVTIEYDPFNDETKITDKCTCSEGSNKKLPVGTEVSISAI
jgi:hypothetical protein